MTVTPPMPVTTTVMQMKTVSEETQSDIPPALAELFQSDTEDEDFDGFSDIDDE